MPRLRSVLVSAADARLNFPWLQVQSRFISHFLLVDYKVIWINFCAITAGSIEKRTRVRACNSNKLKRMLTGLIPVSNFYRWNRSERRYCPRFPELENIVEVNPGISQNKRHTRRRTDGARSGGLRNLNWGEQHTDIALLAQSPVLFEKALTQPQSRMQLLSSDISPPPTSAEADVLRTPYSAIRLREQCRQVVVECALAKTRFEKNLYLACGFINWQDSEQSDITQETQSSPLLFFPVRLITEQNEEGEGTQHWLLNEDAAPCINQHLHEIFKQRFQIDLPVYNPRQSLNYFYDLVEQTIKSMADCSIEVQMRLGIAATPVGINPDQQPRLPELEKIPKQFRFTLAKRLIENLALDDLQTTLKLLAASNDFKINSNVKSSSGTSPDIARVREFAMLLAQYGLGHIEFHQLPELPANINKWVAEIEPALQSSLLRETLAEHEITAMQLVKLAGIVELIDKAPDSIQSQLHPDLAYRGTHLLFKRAKYQAKLIHDELAQLQQHFHLDRIPAKAQLLQLIEELGGHQDHAIDVIDSDYFNARRKFMDFSTEKPTTLSADHKRMLAKLVKVLRFRELFVNNCEYRLALGPAYRGLKTDWDALENVLEYAQELRQILDSAALAAIAISDWKSFRDNYTRSLASLLNARHATQSLLKIIRSSDRNTRAADLLIKAKFLGEQLRSWNVDYGFIENYAAESANSLLHLFTGNAGIDSRTEDLVRDANNRIQHFLIDNHESIAMDQINDTLSWLNTAVNTESISVKDILQIMERAEQHVVESP